MTIYWMLNSHWPSFFGNIFDYYLRPGGAYYGAKKGLRPLSVVFDSYATGDHRQAKVTVVNQTPDDATGPACAGAHLRPEGRVRDDRTPPTASTSRSGDAAHGDDAAAGGPPTRRCSSCAASCSTPPAAVVAENVYWQSQQRRRRRAAGQRRAPSRPKQVSWADMTALNTDGQGPAGDHRRARTAERGVTIRLRNATSRLAFFERAELLATRDGDEILPIEYDDNYVTVFPGETVEVRGSTPAGGPRADWVRVSGHNTVAQVVAIR